MKTLSYVLVIVAVITLLISIVLPISAPQEAVFVGVACFLGIGARIAQASGYHKEQIKALNQIAKNSDTLPS